MDLVSPGVYYARTPVFGIDIPDLQFLLDEAITAPLGRVRLCCHSDPDDLFHEMFIGFRRGSYVPPSHHRRDESFSILKGAGSCVLFGPAGDVVGTIPLGEPGSGRPGYCRVSAGTCHALFVESALLLAREATVGPFRRSDTALAPWAPPEGDASAVEAFLKRVEEEVTK